MPEELLDDAEIGAALQEMGRECMAQSVGVPEEPPHGARVQPAAAHGQEDRVVRIRGQGGPPELEVAREVRCGLLAERHDPLLAALAAHVDDLAVEVDVAKVERDGLRTAEPGGVEELEERAVPQREGRLAVDDLEDLLDLCRLGRVREPP